MTRKTTQPALFDATDIAARRARFEAILEAGMTCAEMTAPTEELRGLPRPELQARAGSVAEIMEGATRGWTVRRNPNTRWLVKYLGEQREALLALCRNVAGTAEAKATFAALRGGGAGGHKGVTNAVVQAEAAVGEPLPAPEVEYAPAEGEGEALVDGTGAPIVEATLAAAEADPEGPEADRVLGLDAPAGAALPGFSAPVAAEGEEEEEEEEAPVAEPELAPFSYGVSTSPDGRLQVHTTRPPATHEEADALKTAMIATFAPGTYMTTWELADLRTAYMAIFGRPTTSDNVRYLTWKINGAASGKDSRIRLAGDLGKRAAEVRRATGTTRRASVGGVRAKADKSATIGLTAAGAEALDAIAGRAGEPSRVAFLRALIADGAASRGYDRATFLAILGGDDAALDAPLAGDEVQADDSAVK